MNAIYKCQGLNCNPLIYSGSIFNAYKAISDQKVLKKYIGKQSKHWHGRVNTVWIKCIFHMKLSSALVLNAVCRHFVCFTSRGNVDMPFPFTSMKEALYTSYKPSKVSNTAHKVPCVGTNSAKWSKTYNSQQPHVP